MRSTPAFIVLTTLAAASALTACGQPMTVVLGSEDAGAQPSSGQADAETEPQADATPSSDAHPDAGSEDAATIPDTGLRPGIDLTATFLLGTATAVRPGGTLHATVSIANEGSLFAPSSELRLYVSPPGLILHGQVTAALPAGTSRVLTIDVPIPSTIATGDYDLFAIIDPVEAIAESDELNNETPAWPLAISAVAADTSVIELGPVAVGCSAEGHTVLSNSGQTITDIREIRLDANTTPEFELLSSAPAVIFPGESMDLGIRYTPSALGQDSTMIRVHHSDAITPIDILVRAEGVVVAPRVDHFTSGRILDLLFVIDNSGSMSEEQQNLADNIEFFGTWATQNQIDYRVAVTTMDLDSTGPQGRFVGDPAVLTPFHIDPMGELARRVMLGTESSAFEQGLEAMYLALTEPLISSDNIGFLRQDAVLAVVFISDEIDQSPQSIDVYTTFLRNLKGGSGNVAVNVIVGDAPAGCSSPDGIADAGGRYLEAATMLNGVFSSICSSDWSPALTQFGSGAGFGLSWAFPLSEVPSDVSSITVDVNGSPAPSTDWSYDAATNSILFDENSIPSPGQAIEVHYGVSC